MEDRLSKSFALAGALTVFEDGRKPTYFSVLDLESKPFWSADEIDGMEVLLTDLQQYREQLLVEARVLLSLHGQRKETESKLRMWQIVELDKLDNIEISAPQLNALLSRHAGTLLRQTAFSALMISSLVCSDSISKHYGPSNVRLRLQFPLSTNLENCRLYCGKEMSSYEKGYEIIDDAYLHWAENGGQEERVMLVLDVWHPNLTESERKRLLDLVK